MTLWFGLTLLNTLMLGYFIWLISRIRRTITAKDTSSFSPGSSLQAKLIYPPLNTKISPEYSFILTLLDHLQNGVIITSLHQRHTTRLYAKKITKGQGDGATLSQAEKQAVLNSLKN